MPVDGATPSADPYDGDGDGNGATETTELERAIEAHDARIAALGIEIWVGNEPTFTDRYSQATEWLTGAVGEDKRRRAERLLAALAADAPGGAVLRCIGRQYAGESAPRSSIGLYACRDGRPAWFGPPDPLLAPDLGDPPDLVMLQVRLALALAARGLVSRHFSRPVGDAAGGPGPHLERELGPGPSSFTVDLRCLCRRDDGLSLPDPESDPRLWRPSIHAGVIPPQGLHDELAREGLLLLLLGQAIIDGRRVACIDLPGVDDVELYRRLLDAVADAALESALPCLVLRGFPPPVDATVSWSTVTPDPAVVEVNAAPSPTIAEFLRNNRTCYAAAAALALAPFRLYYNGTVADSGGGGQITFGGPSPTRSPFFVAPHLLPRLVRYVARHPAISYFFAHDYVGSSGQSVRADELGEPSLAELRLALALLAREAQARPATIWQALSPFLTDGTGNSHRADINVEKLWNASQPARGMLGLVEFRAFRMQHTPERAAALATLLRAVLASLMIGGEALDRLPLRDWETTLHDRFALPFFLEADLRQVLGDLQVAGLGLGPALAAELEADPWRHWATLELGDCTVVIRRALEFWPLLGDASDQQGTSRLVDASTSRIEILLRPTRSGAGSEAISPWRVRANDVELPLRSESDPAGPVRLFGVRYRSFVPTLGLHPTLGKQSPVRLLLRPASGTVAHELTLYEWPADGFAYDGVPANLAEARARRTARCVSRQLPESELPPARPAPADALSEYSLDLRYL